MYINVGNPIVSISSSGSIIANDRHTLECTVTIVAGDLNITWLNGTGDQLTEKNGIMFNLVTISNTVQVYQLIFNPLDYSHIGKYTCQANLTVSRGNGEKLFMGEESDSVTISVQGKFFSVIIAMYLFLLQYLFHKWLYLLL